MVLNDLDPGQTARVIKITSSGGIRRRLIDLGLIEGTSVKCVGKSPAGDPAAYRIRGAVIAIRSEDGANITVERTEDADE